MSHMIGHWDADGQDLAVGAARAKKQFGTLTPLDANGEPLNLKIVFFNNRNYRRDNYPNRPIGFHLALIPFEDENGNDAGDLAIAYDIIDYGEHVEAEKEFQKLVGKKRPGNPPIEDYDSTEITPVIDKAPNNKHKHVLKQTAAYVSTPWCKKIYGGEAKGVEWIRAAHAAGKLVEIQPGNLPLGSLQIFS